MLRQYYRDDQCELNTYPYAQSWVWCVSDEDAVRFGTGRSLHLAFLCFLHSLVMLSTMRTAAFSRIVARSVVVSILFYFLRAQAGHQLILEILAGCPLLRDPESWSVTMPASCARTSL